jgi:hypothetical protein
MSVPIEDYLRDNIATQVLAALIANYGQFGQPGQFHDFRVAAPVLSEMAYFAADCMLAERKKPTMLETP